MDSSFGRGRLAGGGGGREADIRARVAALKSSWLKGGDTAGRDRLLKATKPPPKYVDSYRKSDLVRYEWDNQAVRRNNNRPSGSGREAEGGKPSRVENGRKMEVLAKDHGTDDGDDRMAGDPRRQDGDEVEDDVGDVKPDGDGRWHAEFDTAGQDGHGHPRDNYGVDEEEEGEEDMPHIPTSEEDDGEIGEDGDGGWGRDNDTAMSAEAEVEKASQILTMLEKKRESLGAMDSRFWKATHPVATDVKVRHNSNLAQRQAELHAEEVVRVNETAQALAVLQGALAMRRLTNEALGESDADKTDIKGSKALKKEVERLTAILAASSAAAEITPIAGPGAPEERRASTQLMISPPSTRGNTPGWGGGARGGGMSSPNTKDRLTMWAKKESLVLRSGLSRYDFTALHDLSEALGLCPFVTSLSIAQNWIMPTGASIISPSLLTSTQLTCLDLGMNDLRPQGMTTLALPLSHMYHLKSLKLGSNHMEDSGLEVIGQSLENLTRLETLDLSKNKISPAGVEHLATFLASAKFLADVDFSGNVTHYSFHTSDGAELMHKLAPHIEKLASLERISIASNYIFSHGMKFVSKMITQSYGQLKHVDIGGTRAAGNKIGVTGAKSITTALFHTPLVSINLSFNELGPQGMAQIASALPFQTCLQSLILTGNDIGFAGAKTLAKGMKEMSSLQILNLSNNAITAAGISSLCASWPSDNQIMDLNLSRNPLTMSDKTYQEFDNEGFHRFALTIRNSELPNLHTLDLREGRMTHETNCMLASAVAEHSHLTSLNGLRMPSAKAPLKWQVPHPVKHAELLYVVQSLKRLPRSAAAAITSSFTLYNTMDLSGCGLLKFPTEIFEIPTLENLDVSNNPFHCIPIEKIASSGTLTQLLLRGCNNVLFPPATVRARGGTYTMQYIKESVLLRKTTILPLLICGSPEAGAALLALIPTEQRPRIPIAKKPKAWEGTVSRSGSFVKIPEGSTPKEGLSSTSLTRKEGHSRSSSTTTYTQQTGMGSKKYQEWKKTKEESLGAEEAQKRLRDPAVWMPVASNAPLFYFQPCDLSCLCISSNCLSLFCIKTAVYVLAWDNFNFSDSRRAVDNFLETLASHAPRASVVLCCVFGSDIAEEILAENEKEICQLVTNWMDFEAATVDRAVALTMHMGENGPIRVNLDSPEEGLACLGVEVDRAAFARERAQGGYWMHPETEVFAEAIRLETIDDEYWMDWRTFIKTYADIVFDGDMAKLNSATDALHDLGWIRCHRDPDSAQDEVEAARPVLDVVFTSVDGIMKAAQGAPKSAVDWKMWEVVHFLRKAQATKRNPGGARGVNKARAIRWANNLFQIGSKTSLFTSSSSKVGKLGNLQAEGAAVSVASAKAADPTGSPMVTGGGNEMAGDNIFRQSGGMSSERLESNGAERQESFGASMGKQRPPLPSAPTPILEDASEGGGADGDTV